MICYVPDLLDRHSSDISSGERNHIEIKQEGPGGAGGGGGRPRRARGRGSANNHFRFGIQRWTANPEPAVQGLQQAPQKHRLRVQPRRRQRRSQGCAEGPQRAGREHAPTASEW